MKKTLLILGLFSIGCLLSCNSSDDSGPGIEIPEGYELVWSDEFDDAEINSENWGFELGDGSDYDLPSGWGNNELQLYTDDVDNATLGRDGGNSVLAITAMEDGSGGYSSAKVTTENKISIRFGRVDVRAKMPEGQGIWPAIWMLGENRDEVDWPGCGEIDIVEVLGHEPSTSYSTLHYTNGENGKGETQVMKQGSSLSDSYHIYSVEWTNESIQFSLDGNQVGELAIESDMKEFQRSFYLIMNIAVGGYWPGIPDNTTVFPQTMYVDYVRIFSKNGFEAPAAPLLDLDEETLGGNLAPDIGNSAISESFVDFGDVSVIAFGGGGEPSVYRSNVAIDGDQSLTYYFPGTNWGGAYFELESGVDLSSYTNLHVSLKIPAALHTAEIKLESPITNAAVFLVDYTANESTDGFVEYIIPLSDFVGLDLTAVDIPFSMWNPTDNSEAFVQGEVLIDKLYFE